jgi:uncharacterized protein (TIGR03067 family)
MGINRPIKHPIRIIAVPNDARHEEPVMRRLIASGFVLVACAACLSISLADDKKPKAANDDAKLLQGNWKVVAIESDGRQAPAEKLTGMRWSFKGSEVEFSGPGELAAKATLKLDSGKTPKQIDLTGLDGAQKGKTIEGIFKFEKDQLMICFRDAEAAEKGRPTEFATRPDSGLGMITLEREKE